MIEAFVNYGPIKRHQDYRVLNEGIDWYLLAVGGKSIYVPKWVFEHDN